MAENGGPPHAPPAGNDPPAAPGSQESLPDHVNVKVENEMFYDEEFVRCTIVNCELHSCKLTDCKIYNSYSYGSRIFDSFVADTNCTYTMLRGVTQVAGCAKDRTTFRSCTLSNVDCVNCRIVSSNVFDCSTGFVTMQNCRVRLAGVRGPSPNSVSSPEAAAASTNGHDQSDNDSQAEEEDDPPGALDTRPSPSEESHGYGGFYLPPAPWHGGPPY